MTSIWVIDVGANKGQFGQQLRQFGYSHRIVSFELLNDAFAILQKVTADDSKWECYNFAIGDSNGRATINISENLS